MLGASWILEKSNIEIEKTVADKNTSGVTHLASNKHTWIFLERIALTSQQIML